MNLGLDLLQQSFPVPSADHSRCRSYYWESTAERHGYGYHWQAPADVLSNLIEDFTEMRHLLARPQTDKSRIRLCYVTGQMAGMVAIVLHDMGEHREAHRWFATAGRAAEQSGDRLLHAWVLGREAMVPLNYGARRPPPSSPRRPDTWPGTSPAQPLPSRPPSRPGRMPAAAALIRHWGR
ncbi:hypothetical protein [Streptomyces sp. NBC_01481]|uniref:hypothetical protein n=1 Tax=Streptomyces sp. NBC_01481 TaxID=2975869 RepID=UPI00224E6CDD|nr:hypothetical protein [Streptomyces sp. NBC_01481]MCX4586319.1 hypothetical protein [Streptomyces sp. NBC_01481]